MLILAVFSIVTINNYIICDLYFQYYIRAEMKRSLLNKDLQSQAEFIVENKVVSKSPMLEL